MTSRSYFGKMNSTLGSVVPLAMFIYLYFFLQVNRDVPNIKIVEKKMCKTWNSSFVLHKQDSHFFILPRKNATFSAKTWDWRMFYSYVLNKNSVFFPFKCKLSTVVLWKAITFPAWIVEFKNYQSGWYYLKGSLCKDD